MGIWKLKWTLKTAAHPSNFKHLKRELQSPFKFYYLLLVKFKKGLNSSTKKLIHKNKQTLFVDEFMDLFKIQEIYMESCYDVSLDKKAPVIVDIGANKGFFAMRMKLLYQDATIYCAEPVTDNYEKMKKQFEANQYQCYTHKIAIGYPERETEIYLDPNNSGAHSLFKRNRNLPGEKVSIISLKRFFQENHIEHCDLLKLDCEGAEKEIIESLDSELACKIDKIFYEPMSLLYNPDELNAKLRSLGFMVYPKDTLFYAKRITQ